MRNNKVKPMICNCIAKSYGSRIAEWRAGVLVKSGSSRPFRQGVVTWFGSVKDIK